MNLTGLAKEVADKYRDTLSTLTFNNKIVINTLTEIAKEEVKHAQVVTRVIEERLKRVKPDSLLPIMYLIDSICKNIGGPYNELFQQNLVSNFSYVFQACNEKSLAGSKLKSAAQVRALLYKLRATWGDRYHVFTDHKLHQLDLKVKTIDPAWPVVAPKGGTGPAKPKIHVNPHFVGKVQTAEDETERMRAELLRKEQELLELKRLEVEMQINKYKLEMEQGEEKPESRDPRNRDPRRKVHSEKTETKVDKKSDVSTSRETDRSKKDRSPSNKQKTDSKKGSSNSKSSSSKSSSTGKSSSKSGSKGKDDKDMSKSDSSRKRARENESVPGSPDKAGRIEPLPQPDQSLGRIPKVKRGSGPIKSDDGERKRGNKRPGSGQVQRVSPEKKPKPLFIETDVGPDSRDAPSPQVGWGNYKKDHPDEYRTPVKEENFPWNARMEVDGDDYYRGRGGRNGGRFGRRQQDWDSRGNMRGNRGGRNQDNGGRYMNGRGAGPIQPFIGRGGGRGPVGNNFSFMGGIPDLTNASPEIIRKEVIPTLVRMGEEGKRSGSMNEAQFRELMSQIAVLNETSLIKEQEMRMNRAQENKENQRQGERGTSGRPILLGPPPLINGAGDADIGFRQNDGRSPHKNDLPMADQHILEMIESDPTKSLPIDEQPRMIRFYDETATIVMSDDNVCELTFQPDSEDRRVIIDENIVIFTRVNQGYKEFELDGEKHELKIGPPTRELWVDGKWYECYFNNSAGIKIGNSMHEVFLDGQPPIVKIGEKRPDLCLGRIFALLDGNMNGRIPIFLDRKPQLIDIAGKPHVIQFVEGFKTLTINGHPFRSDFGGFPMVISVHGKKHYLRLTALPPGINLDFIPRRTLSPAIRSPSSQARGPSPSSPPVAEPRGSLSPHLDTDPVSPYSPQDEGSQDGVGLRKEDPLNSLMSLFPAPGEAVSSTGSSYNTNTAESPSIHMPPAPPAPVAPPAAAAVEPPKDVNALFESLKKFDWSGFGLNLGSTGGGIPGLTETAPVEVKPPPELVPQPVIKNTPELKAPSVPIRPIVLASHHHTLKERQESIIEQLYRSDDLQCKSCGVRFSKDEMPQYTSHLDWHFRMKRREKDNAKRAQSRKWYFEKADWIVSDEIEDENGDEAIEEEEAKEEEVPISTVPFIEGRNKVCPVCREEFSQFFKQSGDGNEEEGWYLHNAMVYEGIVYHPECFKDKNNAMDNSLDTSADTAMETSVVAENEVVPKQEPMAEEEPKIPEEEAVAPIKAENDKEESMEVTETETESVSIKEENDPVQETNVQEDPNVEEMETKDEEANEEVKPEEEKAVEDKEEDLSANTSLVSDDNMLLAAPVVTQPKVEIKVKINSTMKPFERLDSSVTTPTDVEDSEFDKDAIVVPGPDQELKDTQKPRMKGKRFTEWPVKKADQDLSGLCSIM